MTLFRFVAVGCLLASLPGCADPAPDPSKIEKPRSVYAAPVRAHAAPTGPLEIVPDVPLACDAAADAAFTATVYWNAQSPKVGSVEIHVRSDGEDRAMAKLWTRDAARGNRRAPSWVRRDTVFELRDAATQAVIASASVPCEPPP